MAMGNDQFHQAPSPGGEHSLGSSVASTACKIALGWFYVSTWAWQSYATLPPKCPDNAIQTGASQFLFFFFLSFHKLPNSYTGRKEPRDLWQYSQKTGFFHASESSTQFRNTKTKSKENSHKGFTLRTYPSKWTGATLQGSHSEPVSLMRGGVWDTNPGRHSHMALPRHCLSGSVAHFGGWICKSLVLYGSTPAIHLALRSSAALILLKKGWFTNREPRKHTVSFCLLYRAV